MPLTKIQSLGITDGTIVNADINASAAIAGTKLSAGAVLQVVSANYSTYTTTTSNTYQDSGLTASITPSSTSNKILILFNVTGIIAQAINTGVSIGLHKSSTLLYTAWEYGCYNTSSTDNQAVCSGSYLDSPSSTSSLTYNIKFRNKNNSNSVGVHANSSGSTITLLEIKG